MSTVYQKDGQFYLFRDGKSYRISKKGIVSKHPYGTDIRDGALRVEGYKHYEVVEVPKHFKDQVAFDHFKTELREVLDLVRIEVKDLYALANLIFGMTSLIKKEGTYYALSDVFKGLTLRDKKVIVKALVEHQKLEYESFINTFDMITDETIQRIKRINDERIYRYWKVNTTLDKHLTKFQALLNTELKKRGLSV